MKNKLAKIFIEAIKSIFSFLAVFFLWLGAVFVYLIKKLFRSLMHFFSRENFRKNKIKIIAYSIVILTILSSGFFVFKNYKVVLIPMNEQKQSTAEKSYLNDLKRAEKKQADAKTGSSNIIKNNVAGDGSQKAPAPKRTLITGKVTKIESGKVIITTSKKEESVILNDKTKIIPSDKKLEINQSVTVFANQEDGKLVAEHISIRSDKK